MAPCHRAKVPLRRSLGSRDMLGAVSWHPCHRAKVPLRRSLGSRDMLGAVSWHPWHRAKVPLRRSLGHPWHAMVPCLRPTDLPSFLPTRHMSPISWAKSRRRVKASSIHLKARQPLKVKGMKSHTFRTRHPSKAWDIPTSEGSLIKTLDIPARHPCVFKTFNIPPRHPKH